MKLLVMKLVCLAVALAGIFLLGLVFDLAPVRQVFEKGMGYWPRHASGALNLRLPSLFIGVGGVIVGLYGFLPALRGRCRQTISFKSAHGDVTLRLAPIRAVLLKVMRNMPETHRICLEVKPAPDKRHACIEADVVLQNCAEKGARYTARMVADCLAVTAREILGLEEISAIRLTITGIHINAANAGKQVRERVLQRQEEEAAAYTAALAHPPMASVTLDDSAISAATHEPAAVAEEEVVPALAEAGAAPSAAPHASPDLGEAEALPDENEAMPMAEPLSLETEAMPEALSEPGAFEPLAKEDEERQ